MLQFIFFIIFVFFFHLHLLLHIDERYIEAELTGHQFDHLRIQALVDRHHDAQAHTLADHLGKAHVHQTRELAHADELRHLQFVVGHFRTAGLRHLESFFTTELGLHLALATTSGEFGLGLLNFLLNFFLIDGLSIATLKRFTLASTGHATPTAIETTARLFGIDKGLMTRCFALRQRNAGSFLFIITHRTRIAGRRQIDLTHDLRTRQLLHLDVLDRRSCRLSGRIRCIRCCRSRWRSRCLHRYRFYNRCFFLRLLGRFLRLGFFSRLLSNRCRSFYFLFLRLGAAFWTGR